MQIEEHQFLSAILNTDSLLVIVLDTQGRIYRFNRACEQTTGYTSREVIGKFVWDCLLLPEDIEPVKALFEGMQDRTIQERQDLYILTRDGSRRLIAWTRTSFLNEQGLLEYVIGIGTDITEKQQAEENLRRKIEELNALHQTILDITAPHKLPVLLQTIVERAARLLNASSGGLFLCDPDREEVRCVVSFNTRHDYTGTVLKYGEGSAGQVALTGKSQIINDFSAWTNRAAIFTQDQDITAVASAPMIWQGRVTGVIHVLHTEAERSFNPVDLDLLSQFANQAAIAVQNATLYELAELQAHQAETLRQAGSVVAATLDQDEAIERILQELKCVVPYDSASVQLLRIGYLEMVGGRGLPEPKAVIGLQFPVPGENPHTVVIQERRPHILGDASGAYSLFRAEPYNDIHSWLGVPLILHDTVIGMLTIECTQPDSFNLEHARLASAFADQVTIALENAKLYALEKQRVKELDALHATIADISAELELTKLLQAILTRAVELLNATGGDLGLYDEAKQEIAIVVSHNMGRDYTGTRMALGEGAMGFVAQTHLPIIIDDYLQWPIRSPQYTNGPWHTVLAAPMLIGNRLVGAIGVFDADQTRRFTASDERLLILLAQQSAIAVENARLYGELQRQAVTDPLTGLYNRRGLFQLGEREVERVRRFGHPLAAIMLDIDHFKQINDTFSHAFGDQVLRALADRCRTTIRETDILGRYGGEEFALLLPETNERGAFNLAQRLREKVALAPVPTVRGAISITISLGVASYTEEMPDLAVLLDHADTAMYAAKQRGRNRVVIG